MMVVAGSEEKRKAPVHVSLVYFGARVITCDGDILDRGCVSSERLYVSMIYLGTSDLRCVWELGTDELGNLI